MRITVKFALLAVAAPLLLLAAACGDPDSSDGDDDGGGSSAPTPTPSAVVLDGRQVVPAPIDELDLLQRESFPVQYALRLVSGLPDGCHEFRGVEVERDDTEITVSVTNTRPDDPDVACTQVYAQRESVVELGTDFTSGTTYTVKVNDKSLEFTAQ